MTDDDLIAEVRRKMDPGAVGRRLSIGAIEQAEELLQFNLPPLVRRLYAEVGDGGFGPGYGFLPLVEGEHQDQIESAVGLYLSFRQGDAEDPRWLWPEGLLPICDWGCAIRSCVTCSQPSGPISVFDPGAQSAGESVETGLRPTHDSVADFLRAWISGVNIWDEMFEPDETRTVRFRHPGTGLEASWTPQRPKK